MNKATEWHHVRWENWLFRETLIVGRRDADGNWLMANSRPYEYPPMVAGEVATHWCLDTLGTPRQLKKHLA